MPTFTILQGKSNKRDKFTRYHKYRYDSYKEALDVFNIIKNQTLGYELKKNECVLTVMYDEKGEPLELYRCYKNEKSYSL